MADCNDCPLEPRIAALEKSDEQHRNTHREIFGRVNKLETENAVQNAKYDTIIEKLEELTAKHDKLNEKLESLEQKPGKRWDGIVDKAIWAVCAAIIAFLLARVGL